MFDLIMRIISGICIGIFGIIGFIVGHVLKGLGVLIQQLTIKAGMILFGLGFIGYIASQI